MGLFDKLFGNNNKNNIPSVQEEATEVDLLTKYRMKYEKMEREGKNISWSAFNETSGGIWPYPVATDGEKDALEGNQKRAISGHAPDISELINTYRNGIGEDANNPGWTIFRDEEKAEYWKNVLITGAENGNRAFQAALVATNGMGGLLMGWLSQDEYDVFRVMYENVLLDDANAGVPEAQYAVAEFCLGEAAFKSEKRKELAEVAMKRGLADAAYLRGGIYELDCYESGQQVEFKEILKFYSSAGPRLYGSMTRYINDALDTGRQMGLIE